MRRLVIVGGGITGLAAAFRAQELLGPGAPAGGAEPGTREPPIEIALIERERRLGGKILTERQGEFLLEGTADSFLTRKPAAVELCRRMGVADRLVGQLPQPIRSYVRRHHRLYPLPEGFSGMVPANLKALLASDLLSDSAKHRATMEPTIPPALSADDESVAHFMARRFGPEVFELLIEPLLSGIYAGDASSLSLMATFPQLREMERRYGSLLKGLARPAAAGSEAAVEAASDSGRAAAPGEPLLPPFLTFPEGMAELIRGITTSLSRVRVLSGRGVRAIARSAEGGFAVELAGGDSVDADSLVVATPAFESAALLAGVDGELSERLAAIPYASVALIHLAFRQADFPAPLSGYGYLIPQVEESDLLACTWSSSKWAGRAPQGTVLLRLYAGRHGRPEVTKRPDAELIELARAELAETLKLQAEPILAKVRRWERGMPQYTLGHLERLDAIEARLRGLPNLLLAGAGYRGVGIPDCIESGFRAAEAAMSRLGGELAGGRGEA